MAHFENTKKAIQQSTYKGFYLHGEVMFGPSNEENEKSAT